MVQRNPRPLPVLTVEQRARQQVRLQRNVEVDPASGCWNWKLGLSVGGYGTTAMYGKTWPAHRLSYFLFVGDFDPALDIDHLCRNRRCCYPEHLEPVPARVNLFRSTNHIVSQLTATHCPKGHPYDAENLHVRPSGRRACRACQREWSNDRYRRIRSGEHVPVPRAVYEKRNVA